MLALILMSCAWVTLTSACSCPPIPGLGRFCRYDFIVRGTALAEYEERAGPHDPKDPYSMFGFDSDFVYSIVVSKAIKVPDSLKGSKMIRVRTPKQFSMCGTRFALDVDAVFFGIMDKKGQVRTGMCEPNVPWLTLSEEDRTLITERIVPFCANSSRPDIRPPSPPPSPPSPPAFLSSPGPSPPSPPSPPGIRP